MRGKAVNFTDYKNGHKCRMGPHKNKGGYKRWNWCAKCTAIWDKSYLRCGNCSNKTRARGHYESRRDYERRADGIS